MDWPLYWRLPPRAEANTDTILDRFLDYIASKDLELYPAQEEAILALFEGKNLVLNTPTGSGKSLVALALHFQSMALGRRSVYTGPIKALVNEKFRGLCRDFGPDQVGMITGDGSVNPQASIICCTAEILSNMALREGEKAAVDDVVMDEFHFYSDKQRGVAWQVPLLALPQTRFLLMSATLGEVDFFLDAMSRLNSRPSELVRSTDRPVPLDFEYRETPLHETLADLVAQGQAPVYLVNFSQREAAEQAQNLMSLDFSSKEEKLKLAESLVSFKFDSTYGKEIQKLLRHGIGLHHAGLLPKYRILVERLATEGKLKVISGTDTLGVGVNVPIRTVLLTKLYKYDGEKSTLLGVRDFHQISGRAGRRGFDTRGTVVVQAPEHVIENLRLKAKAAGDAKKLRKLVVRNPPPRFVMWSKDSFERLIKSQPEPLVSRFQVNHGMLLNVLSRPGGCRAMQQLIRHSHESEASKKNWRKTAFKFFRSLLDRKIVEYTSKGNSRELRVNVDLQSDFSLNQSLSLYLVDTLQVLKPEDPNYALDALTLVESILESPDLILRKQLDRVRSEKMAELRAAGVEYEQRMEELEKCEHPKPNRDFIYETFNIFREAHPWIADENIRPKSIAREMYENYHSFGEYIREYDLQRVEGLLLRYLSDVYKVLEQTVPDAAKNEELQLMATYFGSMVRQVDSSLIDAWEAMRNPGQQATQARTAEPEPNAELNRKRLIIGARNQIFQFLHALSLKDFEAALNLIAGPKPNQEEVWTTEELEAIMANYFQEHSRLRTDTPARGSQTTQIAFEREHWDIEQMLIDPEDSNDWMAKFRFLPGERSAESRLQLLGIGPV